MLHLNNFIGGEFSTPRNQNYLDNIEPATGRIYSRVARSSTQDVSDAVDAARTAFPSWATLPATERSRFLLRIAELIDERRELLAHAESEDTGKPIALARRVDIPRAAANFRFFATAILHHSSEAHSTDYTALNYTLRRPRGVAGLISPWNLPLYLLSWKIAPAIATGNTAVAKPSELTPKTATLLGEIFIEAQLPKGVVNLVHGLGGEAGQALVTHPHVPLISFTGGTQTGASIATHAAPYFKKLSLELGGKNPTIMFADAHFEQALTTSVRAAFTNQGQVCLCGSRIFVEQSIYKKFIERFIAATAALRIGDPRDENTEHGALISEAHRRKVEQYVELAREEGASVLCGGKRPASLPERCRDGFFYEPTVIANLAASCRINREEIFGPVVTIQSFDDESKLVQMANSTPYGLSASIWTENLSRAHRLAERLDVGTVWINTWMLRDLRVPFGGTKQSGVGREGGIDALRFFTEPKNVCIAVDASSAVTSTAEDHKP